MNPNRYLVFGFQSTGKTTFAAALWHLLDSREVSTALTKGKHAGDFRYLEEIAQSWCEGWQVERTKSEQVEEVKINLLHPSSGTELSLEFADLSGETFEKAFETRLCRQTFVDLVKNAAGLLLFVSAIRRLDDVTILDAFAGEEADQMTLEEDQGDTTPGIRRRRLCRCKSSTCYRRSVWHPLVGGRSKWLSSCRLGICPARRRRMIGWPRKCRCLTNI